MLKTNKSIEIKLKPKFVILPIQDVQSKIQQHQSPMGHLFCEKMTQREDKNIDTDKRKI